MVKCVLEDGVKLGWDWKERWAKVVIVVGGGALELEGVDGRGRFWRKKKSEKSFILMLCNFFILNSYQVLSVSKILIACIH